MSLTKTRKVALTGLAAIGVLAGSAAIANAVTSPSSSVTVPAPLQLDAKTDAADDATLANLAKIDLVQATTAAIHTVPGKAIDAELDEEDGNLVYDVEIVTGKGTVEVIVDAGNGKVLAHHVEHDEDGHGDD